MDKKEKNRESKPNQFSYLLGFLVILLTFVCWMNFGPLLSFAFLSIHGLRDGELSGLGDYLIVHAPYMLMFLALFLGSNFILKTRLRELISGSRSGYRWKFSFVVAVIYILLLVIVSLFQSRTISIDTSPIKDKLILLIPILILTPMQAISEELFFRALPARLVYHEDLPKTIVGSIPIVLISGLLFLIPHMGNPEFTISSLFSGLYYFLWGAGAMALGLYTNGFEAPVAMHIANNLYIALIVNYAESSMPTRAIFINTKSVSSLYTVIECIAVFSAIFLSCSLIKKKYPSLIEG